MTDARRSSVYVSTYLFTEDRGCAGHVDDVQLFLKHLGETIGEEQKKWPQQNHVSTFLQEMLKSVIIRSTETVYFT